MCEVSRQLIKNFKLYEIGLDFAGYKLNKNQPLSYHHTIVAHRDCKKLGLGEGRWYWNGSMLLPESSHPYIHVIERVDPDMFYAITSELIDENALGRLDIENLRRIHDIMSTFEKEHCGDRTKKGKMLIKEIYTRRPKL